MLVMVKLIVAVVLYENIGQPLPFFCKMRQCNI